MLAWIDRTISPEGLAVLVIEEDGDFRIDYRGQRGEKNIVHGDWMDGFLSGEFYLVPVPGTIVPPPGMFVQNG